MHPGRSRICNPWRAGLWIGLWALALFGVAAPVAAATPYVQGAYQDPASASTLSVKYAAAQAAGDLNVIVVGWNDSTSGVNSITDSNHNIYLVAAGPTTSPGAGTQVIYYAQNIAGAAAGANTVTVTFNTTVKFPDLRIVEYSGISTSSALDVGVGASGIGTSLSSGAVTTSNANDLLVGANYIGATSRTVGSGYTQRLYTSPDSDLVEDRVVAATGSYSASSTQSPSSWGVMQMAAFRAINGGGDATPPTAPTGLTATTASSSQINLGWVASSDNVAVTGYRIERCQGVGCSGFAQIGTSAATTYNDTGLAASTSYSYQVQATDAAGNLSNNSASVSTSTSSPPSATQATAATGSITGGSSSTVSSSAVSSSSSPTSSPAALLAYINGLSGQSRHILAGQHTNYWDSNPMDIVTPIPSAAGSQVAILGTTNDWDGTSSENFVSLTNSWLAQGGIVMVSQSPQNPLKKVAGSYADVHTPGTAAYNQWHSYLDTQIAKFKQINGTVIWRPFIELDRSWSWWVANQNPADFKIIWQQMHDYFAANGVNNVLWMFNVNNGNTTAGVNAWYPGSAYVDVVSLDAYPPNVSEDAPVYNALVATGKPVMYAETGVHSFNNSAVSLLTYENTSILATIKANFPKIFAVVIWCQNYALPLQLGEGAFMSDSAIITLSDIPASFTNSLKALP